MKYKVNINGLKFQKDSIIDSSDLDFLSEQILLKNGSISVYEEPEPKTKAEPKGSKSSNGSGESEQSEQSEIKPA